ncbi:SAM-dependent methyltransferase [Hyalangium minutum]|uniref:SAM-dependent methyltransferase n=2 Tax=Hyalangium minutum TaxID=394096 RepID=A0A085W4S3_9BACT|nr:SAM-dependent methyltransferase [Hyalangium minutum]
MTDWANQSEMLGQATSWLDGIYRELAHGGDVQEGMLTLHHGLFHLRQHWSRKDWRRFCLEVARIHPLRELLHQCPFTRHGYERPRGYAGDAALIDYLYAERLPEDSNFQSGAHIYRFMYQQPSPRSVRERRVLLAREIDTVAAQVHRPRILSVACGHLREAELSHAVKEHHVGDFIAFDQDPMSLAEVARQHPETAIRPVCGSVRALLTGRTVFGHLDLAYSAGLYDYLSDNTARRLTQLLFNMLNAGGRLLVANFATCPEAGYLEAFMDWWLIYRDEDQMQALTLDIDPMQLAAVRMFRDSEQNVIYLELTRR